MSLEFGNDGVGAILAVVMSDREEDCYAVLNGAGELYLTDGGFARPRLLAALSGTIQPEHQVRMYVHHPYICVTERFGCRGAVVHQGSGAVRQISREDYHADVSSFSAAFLERQGKLFLVFQTQWNRLDVLDLERGELLTLCDPLGAGDGEPAETEGAPARKEFDYFHSLLEVSPGGAQMLSNGWHWGPVDNIKWAAVDRFLQEGASAFVGLDYANDYNWDRPCAFLDERTFVIATDREEDGQKEQLWFYDVGMYNGGDLAPCRKVDADFFETNEYGEVSGQLLCDREKRRLIALSGRGCFVLDLSGRLKNAYPDMGVEENSHRNTGALPWQYSTVFHQFYRYDGTQIQSIPLDAPD